MSRIVEGGPQNPGPGTEMPAIKNALETQFGCTVRIYDIGDSATYPSKNADEWKTILQKLFQEQSLHVPLEDLADMTGLMAEMGAGIEDTEKYYRESWNVRLKMPHIYFYEPDSKIKGGTFVTVGKNILVNLAYLRNHTYAKRGIKMEDTGDYFHPSSRILSMTSSLLQEFYLAGVQQYSHYIVPHIQDNSRYEKAGLYAQKEEETLAGFDAADPQFHWLETGMILAMKKSQQTDNEDWKRIREILRQRRAHAQRVRLGQQYTEKPFQGRYHPKPAHISNGPFLLWYTISGECYRIDGKNNFTIIEGSENERKPTLQDYADFCAAIDDSITQENNPQVKEQLVGYYEELSGQWNANLAMAS